jgi:hypothetical protein
VRCARPTPRRRTFDAYSTRTAVEGRCQPITAGPTRTTPEPRRFRSEAVFRSWWQVKCADPRHRKRISRDIGNSGGAGSLRGVESQTGHHCCCAGGPDPGRGRPLVRGVQRLGLQARGPLPTRG